MEIALGLIVAVLTWVVIFLIMYVAISLGIYLRQEIHHTLRNMKRELRQGLWDLEWEYKIRRQGR